MKPVTYPVTIRTVEVTDHPDNAGRYVSVDDILLWLEAMRHNIEAQVSDADHCMIHRCEGAISTIDWFSNGISEGIEVSV